MWFGRPWILSETNTDGCPNKKYIYTHIGLPALLLVNYLTLWLDSSACVLRNLYIFTSLYIDISVEKVMCRSNHWCWIFRGKIRFEVNWVFNPPPFFRIISSAQRSTNESIDFDQIWYLDQILLIISPDFFSYSITRNLRSN